MTLLWKPEVEVCESDGQRFSRPRQTGTIYAFTHVEHAPTQLFASCHRLAIEIGPASQTCTLSMVVE